MPSYMNSVDISQINCQVAEVRADVILEDSECEGNNVRLWGQIKDCTNQVIPYALLKLVRVHCDHYGVRYEGIAHTVSDCEGFYQFDLCRCNGDEAYKILVTKVQTGEELVIQPRRQQGEVAEPNYLQPYPEYHQCPSHSPYPQRSVETYDEVCSAEVPHVNHTNQMFYTPHYYEEY